MLDIRTDAGGKGHISMTNESLRFNHSYGKEGGVIRGKDGLLASRSVCIVVFSACALIHIKSKWREHSRMGMLTSSKL